tara:strand:- start:1008 stop:1337 length:330 start_codon:yes stop_codon:yes gene_type:complete
MASKNNNIFVKFIIKKAIVASAITFVLAGQAQLLASLMVDTLVEPLFSIDLDKDGKPDLKQMENFVVTFIGIKFPLGRLITQIIKFLVFLFFIYWILTFFMENTNFIKL